MSRHLKASSIFLLLALGVAALYVWPTVILYILLVFVVTVGLVSSYLLILSFFPEDK